MLKTKILSLIIFTNYLLFSLPVPLHANETKPSLAWFSQMKELRSRYPEKSKFETEEEHLEKINSINMSPLPINLELTPDEGTYDVNKQVLEISLYGYMDVDDLPEVDRKIGSKNVLSSANDVISYRTDLLSKEIEIVTCSNKLGAESTYEHHISTYTDYSINIGRDIQSDPSYVTSDITIPMTPSQAIKYHNENENFVKERIKIYLTLQPVPPFYSYYTDSDRDPCKNRDNMGRYAKEIMDIIEESYGASHISYSKYNANHLIHTQVTNIKIIDDFTKEVIYEKSYGNE